MFRSLRAGAGIARACLLSVCALVIAACGGDGTSPRGSAPRLDILAGDGQQGAPNAPLDRPIVVRVQGADGAPEIGAQVRWEASDGGSVTPREQVTDRLGRASADWTLGAGTGTHRARALVGDALEVEFVATTDDHHELLDETLRPLVLTTYEGSGQVVHPDIVQSPATWLGSRRYLAITPYPGGDANRENPSIFGGDVLETWRVPSGLTNPVVKPGAGGYLSDPDIVYEPDHDELWMYYREVQDKNIIKLVRSADGVQWSAPATVASGPNHTIISPSVVRRGRGNWLMWAVDANVGCTASSTKIVLRRSSDGIAWSAPQAVSLQQQGFAPWHIDVQWIPSRSEYWAVYNVKTAGSCTTPALYLATSKDGVTWTTYPSPVLAAGAIPELEDVVYRSTFEYDAAADAITFWYSGARFDKAWIWRSAVQQRRRQELFDQIARPPSAATMMARSRTGIPALLEAP